MTMSISVSHKSRFEEIRKALAILGCREASFLKVQLLFFEALTISRNYGEDPQENVLLAELKKVQNDQFEKTKEVTSKSRQREVRIRQFIVQFRRSLSRFTSLAVA